MPADATQQGADFADLESMFDAEEPGQTGESSNDSQLDEVANLQSGADTETAVETPEGEEVAEVTVDADGNELELEVDPNAEVTTELVIPDDHKVKLNIDGKDVEYTFADLKAGAQKFEAAGKRFDEAAAIRKEYTEKMQGIGTREQQLGQVLQFYIEQSQQFMAKEPNWADLMQNDPQRYLVEKHNWDQRIAQVNQARAVQQNVQRQQLEQQQASTEVRLTQAKQRLVETIPEWADPVKARDGAQAIDRYLDAQGIAPEMRKAIDSAEVLIIARKAMLYDQAVKAAHERKNSKAAPTQAAQGQQAQGQQRQRQQGRVERPGAASPAQTAASRQNLTRANAAKAFNANPNIDTLAGFFE